MLSTAHMVFNDTQGLSLQQTRFLSSSQPFYYSIKSETIPGLPDHVLSVSAPFLAYWVLSLTFHVFDISGWRWLDKYRIHESPEVQKRNRVSKTQVVWAVLLQQFLQTLLGLWWIDSDAAMCGGSIAGHLDAMYALVPTLQKLVRFMFGDNFGAHLWGQKADEIVYYAYWWGIPIMQLWFAMFIIDTWQYTLHRAMHVNKFLFKKIHSVHHRLYVPYAFGALYNHPVEGFLLDSVGAAMAELLCGMTVRQAIFLFTLSTFKTVDDHCGYNLPFDVFQMFTGNNADYHDIHHQVIGIKSNFSQPFFVHWDVLLGTRLTRQEIATRRQQKIADKKEE